MKPWVGTWNATIFGSACIGLEHNVFKVKGQEDCLYLNVYTPKVSIKDLMLRYLFLLFSLNTFTIKYNSIILYHFYHNIVMIQ